jgi:Domain of unknown function (DUF3854)
MQNSNSPLSTQARQFLAERGLDDAELLRRCGITELAPHQMATTSGIAWQSLCLPYPLPDGKDSGFHRYRFIPSGAHAVDENNPADAKLPKIVKKADGSLKKGEKPKPHELRYWQPKNSGVHLYLPSLVNWTAVMADWTTPLAVVEGEFKSLAAVHVLDIAACGLGGIWNWQSSNGLILPEFEKFVWRDPAAPPYDFSRSRTVYVVFDSDVARRSDLLAARDALVWQLADRGAYPRIVNLPETL